MLAVIQSCTPTNSTPLCSSAHLVELFFWSEETFNKNMEGSAIRRIGHERWLRNIAVGLGNAARGAPAMPETIAALRARLAHPSALVREHVQWALAEHDSA